MSSVDELYHRCRWCINFSNGKCTIANEVFETATAKQQIECVVDDGNLVSPIREILNRHLSTLTYASDIAETEAEIDDIIGEIEIIVKNLLFDDEGLEIKNPSTNDHYCKRFE